MCSEYFEIIGYNNLKLPEVVNEFLMDFCTTIKIKHRYLIITSEAH